MKFSKDNNTFPINYLRTHASDSNMQDYISTLAELLDIHDYSQYESFISLSSDNTFLKQAQQLKKTLITSKLKYIFLVGIGGSNLGVKAIYDALKSSKDTFPQIVFVDTVYSELYQDILNKLKDITSLDEILIIGVSKSGTTLESIVNLDVLFNILSSKFEEIETRTVLVTAKDTPLHKLTIKKGISVLECPKNVSGRYSMFTSVGLFPLMCIGINVEDLLKGAYDISKKCLTNELIDNWCFQSAVFNIYNKEKGRDISVLFVFNPKLESLAKWYMQLVSESLGKNGTGITPYTAIGSIDLHSLEQLFVGGMRDKYFTLLNVDIMDKSMSVEGYFSDILPMIKNKKVSDIQRAIYLSVKDTCLEEDISFVEMNINGISAYELGSFMQFKMIEVTILGKLLNVNAFNQPDVDGYKKLTKRILQKDAITQII